MTSKSKSLENKNKMCEIDDYILKYFEIKRRLGKGAYGIVWKALDKKTNQTLAVKKIFDAFRDETDAQRTFREIMFLRAFRNHPNVIQLHNVYKASNNLDIYLSFEFMESDLHNVIKKGNLLKDVHKRFIMYQLLNAINYIHSGNVIHRDLKPSNVLIDTKCRCKLADFGLARSVSQQLVRDPHDANETVEPMLTDYVATRWYRAPEILVASKRYTKGIDMWSLGCILGEMIRGKPIFQGSSTVNQMEKIVSALPEVTEKDILSFGAGFGTALLKKTMSISSAATLDELLIDGTSDANDLVKNLLVLDPIARLTASEALNHKYVSSFRDKLDETKLNADVKPPFRDDIRLSVNEYRSKLYEIVQQTEKSYVEKSNRYNRKREPRTNNRSVDNVPSKSNPSEEKPIRNIFKSQERKNDVTSLPRVSINRSSKKVNISTSPPSYSGMLPKTHQTTNPTNDSIQTEVMISKSKSVVKSTIQQTQSSSTKNTILSPEINGMQRLKTRSHKNVLEKRHSIDGSCNYGYGIPPSGVIYLGDQSSGSGKSMLQVNCPLVKHTEKSKHQLSTSRVRKISQNIQIQGNSIPPENNFTKLMTSTIEDHAVVNDGTNYYQKRLRRLEEQIEKHRKDVKAFCSENTKYSKSVKHPESTSEPKITHGNVKSSQIRCKASNSSCKYSNKHGSSSRLNYLYTGEVDIDHRQVLLSKYMDKKKTTKLF